MSFLGQVFIFVLNNIMILLVILTIRLIQIFIAAFVTFFMRISFQFFTNRLRVASLVILSLNAAPVLVLRVSGVVIQ